MRSLKKATIFFVAILLLFLLSFVSAELNRRDPQAPGDAPPAGGNPPADNPPAGGNPPADNPPAAGGKGGNPPAGAPDAGGKAPAGGAPDAGGKAPAGGAPPAGGKAPAGGAPDAGGKAPAGGAPDAGGKAPAGGNPPAGGAPAAGGKLPAAGGKLPADGTTTGTNDTAIPKKSVNPLTPSVQVNMVSPKMSSKNILFKIGSNITFKWTYSAKFDDPPKTISAYAQPQVDAKTFYPIALNQTLNETGQEVTWVTADNASSLPMAKYKLWICDERGLVAPAFPGGLQVFSGLEFGLYKPQDNNGNCPTCTINSAVSISIIPLLSTIGFTLISIISFNFILI
ncbi:unnamed protein product [Rhizophagus irregularis]|nr:unnamed protein product [Rhizophagus irregularis]